jgi:NADPH:quinone reductase-like Zn-dependent oxidoreductase
MSAPEERVNLVAQIDAFGLEHLRIVQRALVSLRHHEIRIRVHAASLNNRDLLLGQVPSRVTDIRLPLIPLSDCAGEVIEIEPPYRPVTGANPGMTQDRTSLRRGSPR